MSEAVKKAQDLVNYWANSVIKMAFAVIFLAIPVIIATPADACDRCGHHGAQCLYKRAQALHYQPDYRVNYFIGAPIRIEALVTKALRDDPHWQEFQQFKKLQLQAPPAASLPDNRPTIVGQHMGLLERVDIIERLMHLPRQPLTQVAENESPSARLLKLHCATCHSGKTPKGQLVLDGVAPLAPAKLWEIEARLSSDDPHVRMPPKAALTETERCLILVEATRLTRPAK